MALLDAELRQLLTRLRLVYRRVRAGGEGAHKGGGGGGRAQFSEHRDYEPGDDLRDLDWAVYARLEKLAVKVFERASRQPLAILLDASPSMACGAPDKWRYARQLAIALAFMGLSGRHTVRVLVGDRWLGPFDRPERLEALAGGLEGLAADADAPWIETLTAQAGSIGAGNVAVISDLWDERLERALLACRARSQRWSLVHLLAADEREPVASGAVELVDGETGERWRGVLDAATRARYRDEVGRWSERWRAFGRRYGVRYALVDSGQRLEVALGGALTDSGLVR